MKKRKYIILGVVTVLLVAVTVVLAYRMQQEKKKHDITRKSTILYGSWKTDYWCY